MASICSKDFIMEIQIEELSEEHKKYNRNTHTYTHTTHTRTYTHKAEKAPSCRSCYKTHMLDKYV